MSERIIENLIENLIEELKTEKYQQERNGLIKALKEVIKELIQENNDAIYLLKESKIWLDNLLIPKLKARIDAFIKRTEN